MNGDLVQTQERPVTSPWHQTGPAITISDQTGSGAHEVARQLAALLQAEEPAGSPPWKVFDRQLVEKVLEEHHLPKGLGKFMPEDRRSYLADVLDEMMGLRPPSWELVPKIIQTIQHLAETGRVIMIGRGASYVTERMPNVFHARLIGSLPRRIERVQQLEKLSAKEAANFIARIDRQRRRFLRAYFHARVDDDLLYDIVVNTDRLPAARAAGLIAAGARQCFEGYEEKAEAA
jgi:cytidylate kinase